MKLTPEMFTFTFIRDGQVLTISNAGLAYYDTDGTLLSHPYGTGSNWPMDDAAMARCVAQAVTSSWEPAGPTAIIHAVSYQRSSRDRSI
jgi:hypothetical protein